ncbi:hypothetical protein C474_16204 [Halogeometricum pallidum JCM 14848]|uniref:Uncharacterized protein n=1 Tax=Halogeometricum pallidum JCM 14848 TaxID=1227487 RepID=M0CXY1_HALPD|nr:hypothetical protein [Halogeometricum pallidum]ELZ28060.1 hypothetical protein C474_16204 [Halogeometricum pallidum JCM 14848]
MSNATSSHAESDQTGLSVPKSTLFWTCIALAVVLFVLGMFVFTGPIAGIAGVWGASLFVGVLVGYVGYLVWYRFGV